MSARPPDVGKRTRAKVRDYIRTNRVPHEDQPWVPQEDGPWVPHVVAGFSPRSFSDDLVAVLFVAQKTARPDTTSAPSFSKTAVGVLIFKLRPPPPRMTQSSAIMRSSM